MAKQGFSRFKWNRGGYRAVQNLASVQSQLRRYASSAEGGASASVNARGHTGTHFAAEQVQGKFAKGYVVHPTTYEGAAHAVKALRQFRG